MKTFLYIFIEKKMLDYHLVKKEIEELKTDVPKNYDKLLNIYLKLIIEYMVLKKSKNF